MLKVFKAIRFRYPFKNQPVTGHLYYLRDNYDDYDNRNGDQLDHEILKALKSWCTDSIPIRSELIILGKQMDDNLQLVTGPGRFNASFKTDVDTIKVSVRTNQELSFIQKRKFKPQFTIDIPESLAETIIQI